MRSMKHSIKREQSHARMSFAECENVRATLKHMKLSFHLILTLAVMLTMAQGAWAVTETRTVTFYMDGGYSDKTQLQDNWTLLNENGLTLYYSNTNQSDYISQSYSSQKTRFPSLMIRSRSRYLFHLTLPSMTGSIT